MIDTTWICHYNIEGFMLKKVYVEAMGQPAESQLPSKGFKQVGYLA